MEIAKYLSLSLKSTPNSGLQTHHVVHSPFSYYQHLILEQAPDLDASIAQVYLNLKLHEHLSLTLKC